MNILGYLGGHFGSLGAPFGLILALLGKLVASFSLSWSLLGRPFGPSWPKMVKKVDFLNLSLRFGTQVGTQNGEKSMSKTMFFLDAFLTSNFIDFSTNLDLSFRRILDRFLDSKRKS